MWPLKHNVEELRESLKLAEQLAQLSLISSKDFGSSNLSSKDFNSSNISTRKALLQQGTDVQPHACDGTRGTGSVSAVCNDEQKRAAPYVPPKQLLLYLVR